MHILLYNIKQKNIFGFVQTYKFWCQSKLHITFRLFTTVWAGYRAMRSIDPCQNCGWSRARERGRRATDL